MFSLSGPKLRFYSSIAGSRTPHYGNETPRHDGSRTPSHSASWDHVSTPARSEEFDEYEHEPSPSYNPATPGYQPDTPQVGGPFTPQTPGGMYSSHEAPFSPYQASPSPSSSSYQLPSPGNPLTTPSPMGYNNPNSQFFSPMTPGVAASPFNNPQTPGGGMDHMPMEWQAVDLECRIRAAENKDKGLVGQQCIITGISGNVCSVLLLKEARVISVDSHFLEPVRPRENDRCKIISEGGEEEGFVTNIENENDVVVLVGDRHKKYRIYDLCKVGSKDQYSNS